MACHCKPDLVSLSLFSFAKAKPVSLNFNGPDLVRMCNSVGKFGGKWDKTSRRGEHLCFFLSSLWSSLDALASREKPPFSLFLRYVVPLQSKGEEVSPTLCKDVFTWPTRNSFCSGKDKCQFAAVSVMDFVCVKCTFAICIMETLTQYRL